MGIPLAIAQFALLSAVLTAAGCGTPMRWDRPGTNEATLEADTVECMAIARAQHRRLTEQPFLVPYLGDAGDLRGRGRAIPVVPWQQFGPPVWYPYAPWLANDQIVLRHELYDRCLEGKGYARVPDERGDSDPERAAAASSDAGQSGEAGGSAASGGRPGVDATSPSDDGPPAAQGAATSAVGNRGDPPADRQE